MEKTTNLESQNCDVLIVGAGISGLISAREILKADPQLKLLIIEAKNRVGGRTHTIDLKCAGGGTDKWDIGGQWVGKTQPHIFNLIKELNLEIYRQYTEGTKWIQVGDSEGKTYDPTDSGMEHVNKFPLFETLDFLKSYKALSEIISSIDVKDILSSPKADEYDRITVKEWFERNTNTRLLLDVGEVVSKNLFGVPAGKLSFLYFLVYIRSGGNLDEILDNTDEGADALKIVGGTQQISKKLSDIVGWDKIYLSQVLLKLKFLKANDDESPVEAIVQNALDETKISKIIAKRVILSIPPAECSRIRFHPSLPFGKKQLFDGIPQGNYIKCIATYETAFWRKKGFSGEIFSAGFSDNPRETRPLHSVYDATSANEKPALVGFVHNETWSHVTPEVRKKAVLQDMARFLGEEALKPLDYIDKEWGEETFTGGCPAGNVTVGNMDAYARIREPWKTWVYLDNSDVEINNLSRIHFAGTEAATMWIGYMSGAVQSGLRASHEVLLKLGKRNVNWDYLEHSFLNPKYKPQLEWDNSYKKLSSKL
ncbi:hypothetical protein FO519_000052 [Halicephalobus sp. NKZ332]|nr:hypothetical protein FO519_000052 [Halicephalobus sp. NKZ332]